MRSSSIRARTLSATPGILEATGSGGLVIHGDVANSGQLWADWGNLTVTGNVNGSGLATIDGSATLEFGAASNTNIYFDAGSTGTLKLDDLQDFTGQVSGLTNANALDLGDINFSTVQTPIYDPANGVLTVTDGTHTANIALEGNFTMSAWQTSSDGNGGVLVVDTPRSCVRRNNECGNG